MSSTIIILPSSLQTALHELIERVNACDGGIRVILLSTSEGVPLGRILKDGDDALAEDLLRSLESTWAPAPKQLPLLQQGKIQCVTAEFSNATILHLYEAPVVVTLLLYPHSNLGAIRSTALPLLKELLRPLCDTLLSSLSPNPEDEAYYQ